MDNAVITFSFAGLPAGYCYTSPERFALDIVSAMQGYLPGTYSTIIRSSTEPVATDRDKVWVQVNADGAFTGRQFTYAYGKWVMGYARRVDPGDVVSAWRNERIWFEGSESAAWRYDGGDGTDPSSNPPTATTGAMWEYDSNYAGRFPLMAGTTAKPTTYSIGDTGGEEDHVLTTPELPSHTHGISASTAVLDINATSSRILYGEHDTVTNLFTQTALTQPTGDGTGHNNTPLFRVGAWLKPTNRQFYTP